MTKYTTRELLENFTNFVISKDILIDLLSQYPEILNHPPFSAGPPSAVEIIAWGNAELDITLGKASARISEALGLGQFAVWRHRAPQKRKHGPAPRTLVQRQRRVQFRVRFDRDI